MLPKTPYVGEVGLDSSRDHRGTLDVQRGVLRDVLWLCARAGGKVLSLHSRGAPGLILDALSSELGAGTPILHWYIGTAKQVARASDIGCWFSVGPAMLASERGRAAVLAMPRESVLPESDGPFGRVEDQPLRPWEAWSITGALSQIWREDEVGVVHQLRSNFAAFIQNGLTKVSADDILRNSSYS